MTAIACGIGWSPASDALEATQEAARQAREALVGGAPQAALIVSAGDHHPGVADAAREIFGPIPVSGGGSAGLLTDAGIVSHGVAFVCFRSDEWAIQAACAGSATGPVAAAERAARLILSGRPNRRRYPRGLALGFADGRAAVGVGPLSGRWQEIMGSKLKSVWSLVPDTQGLYCGLVRDTGPLAVLCLEGAGPLGIGIGSGWAPLTPASHATRVEATLVHELDGRPAAEVYQEALPGSAQDPARFPLGVCFPEDRWLIRSVVGIDGSALRLGGEIPAGAQVRVMSASLTGLQQATQDATGSALKRLEGHPPSALLVLESAARSAVQNGTARREWGLIRDQVPARTPVLGWLTASELIPDGGQSALQNGSVIIIALP